MNPTTKNLTSKMEQHIRGDLHCYLKLEFCSLNPIWLLIKLILWYVQLHASVFSFMTHMHLQWKCVKQYMKYLRPIQSYVRVLGGMS